MKCKVKKMLKQKILVKPYLEIKMKAKSKLWQKILNLKKKRCLILKTN